MVNDIKKMDLDQTSQKWFDADELSAQDEDCAAPVGDKAMYLRSGKHTVVVEVVARSVHYRIAGVISRRRAITILLGIVALVSPSLTHIVGLISSLLSRAAGP